MGRGQRHVHPGTTPVGTGMRPVPTTEQNAAFRNQH